MGKLIRFLKFLFAPPSFQGRTNVAGGYTTHVRVSLVKAHSRMGLRHLRQTSNSSLQSKPSLVLRGRLPSNKVSKSCFHCLPLGSDTLSEVRRRVRYISEPGELSWMPSESTATLSRTFVVHHLQLYPHFLRPILESCLLSFSTLSFDKCSLTANLLF